jgi:hypothetical protein
VQDSWYAGVGGRWGCRKKIKTDKRVGVLLTAVKARFAAPTKIIEILTIEAAP